MFISIDVIRTFNGNKFVALDENKEPLTMSIPINSIRLIEDVSETGELIDYETPNLTARSYKGNIHTEIILNNGTKFISLERAKSITKRINHLNE